MSTDTLQIEDEIPITSFEPLPTKQTLYLTAVRYSSNGTWMGGPHGSDKDQVLSMLRNWNGIDRARIYTVTLPVDTLPP